MKIESVIHMVNTLCRDHSYSRARSIILNEWKRLTESKNYHLLNFNAQQFIKILHDEKSFDSLETLTNSDKRTLNLINTAVRSTQFNHAKQIISQHETLLEKDIAQRWLTSDAKVIYEAWKKSV